MILKFRILLLRLYYNSIGILRKESSANELLRLFSTPRSRVIRQKEIEILEKASTEEMDFEGQKIKLYQWGTGDQYILLCHGWESNAGSLGAYVEPLRNAGYSLISYDGPAHGESEGSQTNLIDFKKIAMRIIENKGMPDAAIGHSLGANMIILLSYEEQLRIPKVVLISPFNQLRAIYLGFKDILRIPESIYSIMLDKVSKRFNYNVREMEFGKVGQDSPLENILIMHDKKDRITPFSHSHSMDRRWENAELKEIEGSGHYKILWNENSLKAGLEFLLA